MSTACDQLEVLEQTPIWFRFDKAKRLDFVPVENNNIAANTNIADVRMD